MSPYELLFLNMNVVTGLVLVLWYITASLTSRKVKVFCNSGQRSYFAGDSLILVGGNSQAGLICQITNSTQPIPSLSFPWRSH